MILSFKKKSQKDTPMYQKGHVGFWHHASCVMMSKQSALKSRLCYNVVCDLIAMIILSDWPELMLTRSGSPVCPGGHWSRLHRPIPRVWCWQGSANITTITWQLDQQRSQRWRIKCKICWFHFYHRLKTRKCTREYVSCLLHSTIIMCIRNDVFVSCFFLSILIKVNPPKPELILTLAFRAKTQGALRVITFLSYKVGDNILIADAVPTCLLVCCPRPRHGWRSQGWNPRERGRGPGLSSESRGGEQSGRQGVHGEADCLHPRAGLRLWWGKPQMLRQRDHNVIFRSLTCDRIDSKT